MPLRYSTLRLLRLFGAFWEKVWALGAKIWDPIMKVQEPEGKLHRITCYFHFAVLEYIAFCYIFTLCPHNTPSSIDLPQMILGTLTKLKEYSLSESLGSQPQARNPSPSPPPKPKIQIPLSGVAFPNYSKTASANAKPTLNKRIWVTPNPPQ